MPEQNPPGTFVTEQSGGVQSISGTTMSTAAFLAETTTQPRVTSLGPPVGRLFRQALVSFPAGRYTSQAAPSGQLERA